MLGYIPRQNFPLNLTIYLMIIHSHVVIANERDFIYLKEKWNGNYRDKVLDLWLTVSLLLRSCVIYYNW